MYMNKIKNEGYPEILNEFIEKMQTDKKSINTIKNYSIWIARYLKYMKYIKYKHGKETVQDVDISKIHNSMFEKIDINDIEKFKKYLEDIKKDNANSINRTLASLKTFYKFLIQKKIINSNIFSSVDRIQQSQKVRKPLTKEEAELLLKTIKNSNNKYKDRDYFIFLLFLDIAARCFEVTKLKLNQICNDGSVILHGKGDKERIVYMSDFCMNELKKYLIYRNNFLKLYNFKSDYLFVSQRGTDLSENTVLSSLKRYAIESGLDEKKISPHVLRHTSASLKYNIGGVDIRNLQEFLGHSNISTTQTYVDVYENKKKQLANSVILDL